MIGCGNIGRLVAKFALGMDMKVLAYDIMPDTSFAPSADFRFTTLEEALTSSDILSLHCPPLQDGRPLLDAAALAREFGFRALSSPRTGSQTRQRNGIGKRQNSSKT